MRNLSRDAAQRRIEACMTDVCGLGSPDAADMHAKVHADVQEGID